MEMRCAIKKYVCAILSMSTFGYLHVSREINYFQGGKCKVKMQSAVN